VIVARHCPGLLLVGVLVVASLPSDPALAQPACSEAARPLTDSERARGDELVVGLRSEARRARRWRLSWVGINAGLAVSSFAPMPFYRRDQWPDLIVSGAGSVVSAVFTAIWPLDVERAQNHVAPSTCAALTALEAEAAADAADEEVRTRWPWHLLNVGVGGLYYVVIADGFGHQRNGVLAGVSAFAIGEVQLLTQPTRLAHRWREQPRPEGVRWLVLPSAAPTGVRLSLMW
jgi:hypothetical protein